MRMTAWVNTVRSLVFGPWWYSVLAVWGAVTVWLMFAAQGPSNVPLLTALVLAGSWVGWWVRQFHGWHCVTLVPGLQKRLVVLSLTVIVSVALALAAALAYAGNPLPAVGPALLAGTVVAYGMLRPPAFLVSLTMLGFLYYLLLHGLVPRLDVPPFDRAISGSAVQMPALALAAAFLALLKRRLGTVAAENQLSGYAQSTRYTTTTQMVKGSVWFAVCTIFADVLMDLMFPSHDPDELRISWVLMLVYLYMFMRGDVFHNFQIAWLMGIGGTRAQLARRVVGRIVLAAALPLLTTLFVAEAVLSLLSNRSPSFESLLIWQILAFVPAGLLLAFRRQYSDRSDGFLPSVLYIFSCVCAVTIHSLLSDQFPFGIPGYAMLVLLLIGGAAAMIYAGGRGLARADHLW